MVLQETQHPQRRKPTPARQKRDKERQRERERKKCTYKKLNTVTCITLKYDENMDKTHT